jgi:hypothetical protein
VGEAIGRAAGPDLDRFAANLRTWFRDWAAEVFFCALGGEMKDRRPCNKDGRRLPTGLVDNVSRSREV